ncbi:T9SS type A sorting domain-containing protein [candidate division KSB1 bacterium]|nr:T9SS type A sorting domain-containing protein [candidate division KSB1 bacterium]
MRLDWRTESEVNTAGFNVYRSQNENSGYEKINDTLIAGRGSAVTGAEYSCTDRPSENGTWYYKLEDVSLDGTVHQHGPITVMVTGVQKNQPLPDRFDLLQNWPNPFNPSTQIGYAVPKAEFVTIRVYDLSGKLVRTLVNERKSAGNHRTVWDRTDDRGQIVPSGIYFYRMRAGKFEATKKMTLLK